MSVRVSTSPVGCLVGLGILAFTAIMTTVIVTVGIWPGEAKLVAPILCPDDRPDPFVVADSHQVSPVETSSTCTLYSMGPRGDHPGYDDRNTHATTEIREKTPHLAAAARSNPGIDAEYDG